MNYPRNPTYQDPMATPPDPNLEADEACTGELAQQVFREAFERLGGVDELVDWGGKEPARFYALLARLGAGWEPPPPPPVWATVSPVPELTEEQYAEYVRLRDEDRARSGLPPAHHAHSMHQPWLTISD